jgi:hypothetical protein
MEKGKKGGKQVNGRMTSNAKIGLMLLVLAAVAIVSGFWATSYEQRAPPFEPRPWPPFPTERMREDLELFYTIKTIVSSVNMTLLAFLLVTYIGIYRKTRSEFTVGLIVFSMVLLLYAMVSNPIVQVAFGYRAFGLGPFAMLPDLFSLIALAVLLYLTLKY